MSKVFENKTQLGNSLMLAVNFANKYCDGHLTIMKFTTNWRVDFGAQRDDTAEISTIEEMGVGKTLDDAIEHAIRIEIYNDEQFVNMEFDDVIALLGNAL